MLLTTRLSCQTSGYVIENAIKARFWPCARLRWPSRQLFSARSIVFFVTDLDCIVFSKLSVIHGSVAPVNLLCSSLINILQ